MVVTEFATTVPTNWITQAELAFLLSASKERTLVVEVTAAPSAAPLTKQLAVHLEVVKVIESVTVMSFLILVL